MEIDSATERELGPDGDLVASMITTTVIPLLCKFFGSGGVDPYSSKHVKRAIDLSEQIELCVERHEAKFQVGTAFLSLSYLLTKGSDFLQTFAKAFLVPFHRAIDQTHELIVPALDPNNPPPPFDPGAVPARRRFLFRRIKLLTGLLAWRKAVGAIAGLDDLLRRLLVDVMLPVAHGGWDVGGQEIMSKVRSHVMKSSAFALIMLLSGQVVVAEGCSEARVDSTLAVKGEIVLLLVISPSMSLRAIICSNMNGYLLRVWHPQPGQACSS